MTVSELIKRIIAAYPAYDAKAAETFSPVFRARLQRHEGAALAAAANEVLGSFKPKFDQKFPIPVDFEQHLPSGKLNLPKEAPKLDFEARNKRARHLIEEWRIAQGDRAAGGNPLVMRALLTMVQSLASLWSWSANPNPIRLSRKQVRLIQHRAISQERMRRFGALPKSADEFWRQVSEIAAEWRIETARADWESTTPERKEAEAA